MNSVALLGWAVLILAPRGWRTLALLPRYAVPGAIAVLYVALIGAYFASAGGGFGSIAEVRRLFASDPVLVAGWGHYLASARCSPIGWIAPASAGCCRRRCC